MPDRNASAKKKLALVVNGVLRDFNFAVGGGYALELHGLTSRESRDQDWFASLDDIVHSSEIWGYEFPHFGVLADKLVAALKDRLDFFEALFYAKAADPDLDEESFRAVLAQIEEMDLEEFSEYLSDESELDELKAFFRTWAG